MQQASLGRHHGGGIIGQTSMHRGVIVIIIIIIIVIIIVIIKIIISIWEGSGDIWTHLEGIWKHLEASRDIWETPGRHLGGI